MIIRTSANQFFRVTDTGVADLAHVWNGVEVKFVAGRWSDKAQANVAPQWIDKKGARSILVRKAATRVVEA